jgi:hypothetical protein
MSGGGGGEGGVEQLFAIGDHWPLVVGVGCWSELVFGTHYPLATACTSAQNHTDLSICAQCVACVRGL